MPDSTATDKNDEPKPEPKADDVKGATPDNGTADDSGGAAKALKAERDARRSAERELERVQKAVEADKVKALEEAGNFKILAETHATKLAALEPKVMEYEANNAAMRAQLEKAEATLKGVLDSRKADLKLSPAIIELLDSKSMTEQLEWLNKNAAELAASKASALPVHPAASGGSKTEISEEQRRKLSRPTVFA